ncbi:hypothetical protein B0H11DRAFT_2402337 [Mycena galericulata]|nr:hypothetical protein B0H11DRAFT_2402337 [Mycena galericulata]
MYEHFVRLHSRELFKSLQSTIAADGVISGFASTVSALLAEATSDPVYLDAALDSVNFILAHLCPEFLVQTQISARLLRQRISDTDWQTTDGIITQGSQEFGDKYIMGGLRAAYVRNVVSSDLRGYVHDFIGVQFNAVVDLASENGNSVYGGAWTGPPYDIFAQNNQTLATSALLSAILLDGGNPKTNTSSSAPPLSSSTGSPLPISGSRIPHTHKPQAGAIAGGIGGGVLLLAIAVALWIFFRRRAQWGPVSSPESAPITAFDSAAPASLVMRGNKRHPQAPLSAISSPTPIRPTDIPTSDLMRLVHQLSDRLRGRRWDEEEMPPEYGSES